jgi:hypothetical protein
MRVSNRRTCLENQLERQRMVNRIEGINSRIVKILHEEQTKRAALQPYLSAIRSIMAGESPIYVQTIQAKICQSLHFMCIADEQLGLMKKASDFQTRLMKAESLDLADRSTRDTLNLLNKISTQDDENHHIREAFLNVLKTQNAIIRRLDLQSQESRGTIDIPISGDEGENFVKLDLTRTAEQRLSRHYMDQMEASMELGKDLYESSSSHYVSPVSVLPKTVIMPDSKHSLGGVPLPSLTT